MKKQTKNHYRIDTGKWGENLACQYLSEHGLTLQQRNVRTPYGEIDLVMEANGQTVFIEVKTRSNDENGYPEDAITDEKMERMSECAQWFMEEIGKSDSPWRADVVAVIGHPKSQNAQIEWFQNEF
jgi:putative endonuclease